MSKDKEIKSNILMNPEFTKVSQLEFCDVSILRKSLRFYFKVMKKNYLSASNKIDKKNTEEWLTDNFYILEQEIKNILKDLKCIKRLACIPGQSMPFMYMLAYDFFVKSSLKNVNKENIICMIESLNPDLYLSVSELEFLPVAIKISLITSVYNAVISACDEVLESKIIAHAIKNLKNIDSVDFAKVIENISPIEKIFLKDPLKIYPKMDKQSKAYYRYLLSIIYKKNSNSGLLNEKTLTEEFLSRAQKEQEHIGKYLIDNPHIINSKRKLGKVYILVNVLLSLLVSIILGILTKNPLISLIIYLPIWEIVRPINEYIILKKDRADFLPRIDIDNTVPEEGKTLVVVSTIIPKADQAKNLKTRLEKLYFSNGSGYVNFCILADFTQNKYPESAQDKSQIDAAVRVIRFLNNKYGNKFSLFIRKRVYSRTQKSYIGWERKRGAITELIRFIKGDETSLLVFEGDKYSIKNTKYILALDADTELLMDSAQKFVATALHPLNKAVVDHKRKIVISGHGIFTPKLSIDLESAKSTLFSRIMAGCGGTTMYDISTKDLYQDLFGESIFSGKGLIDVDAYYEVLDNKFSEDTVLSHDILEGVYLRAGFVADVELTDGYPSNISSWLSRLHRWVRGDWQNVNYVFDSSLPSIARYKIFDNLRRSITPIASLICIVIGIFLSSNELEYGYLFSTIGFLSVTLGSLFGSAVSIISSGWFTLTRKFYTQVIPQAFEYLFQAIFSMIMLVDQSIVLADAILRALYRKFISKRNMLEWTTAAQSENKKMDMLSTIKKFFWAEFIGVLILILTPLGYLKIFGILFSGIIPLSVISGYRNENKRNKFPQKYRELLISYTADMWKFYEDNCTREDNYLPPDNIQISPIRAIAHRTSPTNIGFLMISTLSARDFDFIDTEALYNRINNTLSTVEKLKKWHGNLYNWYNNVTLETLDHFISTVDSGNFVSCLVAVKEGLKDYYFEKKELSDLVVRIQKIIDETDLSKFYCKKRNLFSIGFDARKGEFVDSYYDFLMSEARLTSYFAIAKRQVPKKHWGSLSRTLSRNGLYAGPVSWTGTMFEFFMPHLLLPTFSESLLDEALRYCVYCQRKRIPNPNIPWGISESAFYAFDNNLYYQYKAHGVQKLGVKQNLDKELVISPYSTFLTVAFAPDMAMKNLYHMEKLGFKGVYGFFEAVDFTKPRVDDMEIIKSYMAHHVGMSIIAATNAVFDNRMQKRFMRDKNMKSTRELLEEKIARDAVVFDNLVKSVPQKNLKHNNLVHENSNISPVDPKIIIFKNADLTSILTDNGSSYLMFGDRCITRKSTELIRKPQGVFLFVHSDNLSFSATAAPFYEKTVQYKTKFSSTNVSYFSKKGFLQVGMLCCMHKSIACEQRQIIIKNLSYKKKPVDAMILLEPILAKFSDYISHPAFSKLFVTASYDKGSNSVIFTRRCRSGETSLYLAVGFLENVQFEFMSRKEDFITSGNIEDSVLSFWDKHFKDGDGLPDCIGAIKVTMDLLPSAQKELTFIMTVAESYSGIISNIIAIRNEGRFESKNLVRSRISGNAIEDKISEHLLPILIYTKKRSAKSVEAMRKNTRKVDTLWSMSISGDLPIILLETTGLNDVQRIEIYVKTLKKLKICGIPFDLVITYREMQGETLVMDFLRDIIHKLDADVLVNKNGGIFLVDLASVEEEKLIILEAVARYIVPENLLIENKQTKKYLPIKINHSFPVDVNINQGYEIYGGTFVKDRFYVNKKSPLPYTHILANPTFGTLLSSNNLGFTWASNSRENKLTPWNNDPATDNDGEMLILSYKGLYYNLLAGSLCSFSPHDAMYEGIIDDLKYIVKVWVPSVGDYKYCEITFDNLSGSHQAFDLAYYVEPILGVGRTDMNNIYSTFEDEILIMKNCMSNSMMSIIVDGDFEKITSLYDSSIFFQGKWWQNKPNLEETDKYEAIENICGAVIIGVKMMGKSKNKILYRMAYGKDKRAVTNFYDDPKLLTPGKLGEGGITISTPDKALDYMINTWIPHQILCGRLWSRTGFYQCGGAYGFRDQLQDILSYTIIDPNISRQYILRACRVQFKEGDVLHWWHNIPNSEGGVRGVRTRYSDDLLWLPFVVHDYVIKTGDKELLNIEVGYLDGEILKDGEQERYFVPTTSKLKESVYQHCIRAINHAHRLGEHGLPLIGCGDWSDGYNRVGVDGRGESVWLAMFFSIVADKFAEICSMKDDPEMCEKLKNISSQLKKNIDAHCWDGKWYLRAFYDDGSKMGGSNSIECMIDSLPQSFSVFAKMPNLDNVKTALSSAVEHLVDDKNMIIKLFSQPFVDSSQNPGYVKSYPRGLRENGGQYTHAGIWLALALIEIGEADKGYKLLQMMNPAYRSKDNKIGEKYKIEPYYLAGDIYSNPSIEGHGGWSIYTGSAGWYYKVIIEAVLGIVMENGKIKINPRVPSWWNEFSVKLNISNTIVNITASRGDALDEDVISIPLDGGEHNIHIEI